MENTKLYSYDLGVFSTGRLFLFNENTGLQMIELITPQYRHAASTFGIDPFEAIEYKALWTMQFGLAVGFYRAYKRGLIFSLDKTKETKFKKDPTRSGSALNMLLTLKKEREKLIEDLSESNGLNVEELITAYLESV